MSFSIGEQYHGITLLHLCGQGAYGEVYCGEDISGRRLAVKIISKKKLGDAWRRELKGVVNYRKITDSSPQLLKIFHVEEDEDSFFYTMEPADSLSPDRYSPDTLAARLQQGALEPSQISPVLAGIFSGIRMIHQAGFVHRDIKPENIIFAGGVPKLGDIGLLSSRSATVTQLAGTLEFLPPEIRSGEGEADGDCSSRQRNDFYAFGKVIYCVVTGAPPQQWPAVPPEIPLTLTLKLFLRLSCQLCSRDPLRRITNPDRIERELSEIEKKLRCGETVWERFSRWAEDAARLFFSDVRHVSRALMRHWILLFASLFLLLFTLRFIGRRAEELQEPSPAGVERVFREKGADMPPLKECRIEKLGLSMQVPAHWEIMAPEFFQKRMELLTASGGGKDFPLGKKGQELMQVMLQQDEACILCDFDPDFADNIIVQRMPVSGETLRQTSDAELRLGIQKIFQGEIGFKTEIYETRRSRLGEKDVILIDLSHEPGKTRVTNCIFLLKDQSVSISLTAKAKTFPERLEEFNTLLATLKWDKK